MRAWLCLVALTGTVVAGVARAEEPAVPVEYVQGWLGVVDTDGGWVIDDAEGGQRLTGDLGALPFAGGAGQRLWGEGMFRWGFEGGGLISWKSDRWAFASSNGTLRVAIDSSLLSLGVFMGGVASWHIGSHVRLYAAAGPSLTWAWLETDDLDDRSGGAVVGGGSIIIVDGEGTTSDVSFAPYARAGVEFEFDNGFAVGVSARYADDEFDFGDQGEIALDDVMWLLTLGARL